MRSRSRVCNVCVIFTTLGLLCVVAAHGAALVVDGGKTLDLVNVLEVHGLQVDSIGGLAPGGSDLYTGDILWGEYEDDWLGYHRFSSVDGNVQATGDVPGAASFWARPTGTARNGSHLFMTAFTDETTGIVEFIPGEASAVAVYPFQGTESNIRSKGLTHDGRFLWQAHYSPNQGHLYAINPLTGDRVNDLRVDPYPYGLAYDGRYFWVSHHNPFTHTSYIARYDRSGAQLATYSLPASMSPNAAIGDLAVAGSGLFAHVLGGNEVAHFSLPPVGGSPPSLPGVVLAASVETAAGIGYDGKVVGDVQEAADYGQLPIAASVERVAKGSSMDVAGLARSYYDEDGVHNMVNAIAYGQDYESDLLASGTLTVSKSILVSPSAAGLPTGTPVNIISKLTFNGLLQAMREEGEGWPDANGLAAIFTALVIKTGPGSNLPCFVGSVSLLGGSGDPWVQTVLTGDADTAALQQACDGLVVGEDLAYLELDHVKVDFSVPAVIGEEFSIDIIFHAQAFVLDGADGLGAEAAFGIDGELRSEYRPGGDPEGYDDGYKGGPWPRWEGWVPEPSTMALLLVGLPLLRRRKNLRLKNTTMAATT